VLHDAQVDELIDANPCVLKKGDLPTKVDADPTWRKSAVFTRDEIETLVSHVSLPEDRRALYGLIFLGAMHFGEDHPIWADQDLAHASVARLGDRAPAARERSQRLDPFDDALGKCCGVDWRVTRHEDRAVPWPIPKKRNPDTMAAGDGQRSRQLP
jgi:hypothetical protein